MIQLLAVLLFLQDQPLEKLSSDLRSEKVEERDRATVELKKVGEAARTMLEKLAREEDTEVAKRALALLRILDTHAAMDTFGRIRDSLAKAPAVRIQASGSGELTYCTVAGKHPFQFRVAIALKEGNRARVTGLRRFDRSAGEWEKNDLVSDGTGLRVRWSGDQDKQVSLERVLPPSERLTTILVTSILILEDDALDHFLHGTLVESSPVEIEKLFPTSDFTRGSDDQGTYIDFLVRSGREKEWSSRVRLWYDPASYRLLKKHAVTRGVNGAGGTVDENFEEVVTSGDLPDDEFLLEKGKK